MNTADRHPSTQSVTQWFHYDHLPEHLKDISKQCHDLAESVLAILPDSPELTVGLRKLLEAKDSFVRATVEAHR